MSPFRSHHPPGPRGRAGNERGAILVEAAFVLPVMILFVMAIIEFGLAFKDLQTVFTATRVGARTGSAEPRQFGYADDIVNAVETSLSAIPSNQWQELWVYKARADGKPSPNGDFNSCSPCVRYHWDGATWIEDQNDWPATGAGSQSACGGTSSPGPPDALGVYLKVRHDMLTGFFGSAKTLTDNTVVRLEPLPISSCQG